MPAGPCAWLPPPPAPAAAAAPRCAQSRRRRRRGPAASGPPWQSRWRSRRCCCASCIARRRGMAQSHSSLCLRGHAHAQDSAPPPHATTQGPHDWVLTCRTPAPAGPWSAQPQRRARARSGGARKESHSWMAGSPGARQGKTHCVQRRKLARGHVPPDCAHNTTGVLLFRQGPHLDVRGERDRAQLLSVHAHHGRRRAQPRGDVADIWDGGRHSHEADRADGRLPGGGQWRWHVCVALKASCLTAQARLSTDRKVRGQGRTSAISGSPASILMRQTVPASRLLPRPASCSRCTSSTNTAPQAKHPVGGNSRRQGSRRRQPPWRGGTRGLRQAFAAHGAHGSHPSTAVRIWTRCSICGNGRDGQRTANCKRASN